MYDRNFHCSFCGSRFPDAGTFPRTCHACGGKTYANPIPVVVVLVPVDGGLVAIRRNTDPGKGTVTLPGGYMDVGETWQEGARRELLEETGIDISADDITLYDVGNGLDDTLVVFGVAAEQPRSVLRPFSSEETEEVLLISGPTEMGFALHTKVIRRYFTEIGRRTPKEPGSDAA